MEDKEWVIFSYMNKDGKKINAEICEGTNAYGDGPARTIGVIESYEDAKHICDLHNASLK